MHIKDQNNLRSTINIETIESLENNKLFKDKNLVLAIARKNS